MVHFVLFNFVPSFLCLRFWFRLWNESEYFLFIYILQWVDRKVNIQRHAVDRHVHGQMPSWPRRCITFGIRKWPRARHRDSLASHTIRCWCMCAANMVKVWIWNNYERAASAGHQLNCWPWVLVHTQITMALRRRADTIPADPNRSSRNWTRIKVKPCTFIGKG